MSVNWRSEAEVLARAIGDLSNIAHHVPGHNKIVREAMDRHRASKRSEREAGAERMQTSLLPEPSPVPYRPYVQQDTSRDAAAAYSQATAKVTRARVLAAVTANPQTDQELARRLSVPENSIRPRRVELVAKGVLEDSGERRKTAAGRKAIVWRLA